MIVDKACLEKVMAQSVSVDVSTEIPTEELKTGSAYNIEYTNDLSPLLATGAISDIKITIHKQAFNLHKAILAQRSLFFKCAFEGSFKEKSTSEMEIEEVDPDDFKDFVKLIYSDIAPILPNSISTLMKLADRFRTDIISKRIEQVAIESLNKQNACKLLKYSHRYNHDMLKDCCLQIISDNWDDIIHTKEVEDLDKEELLNIMRAKQKGK
jgi:speckle-type POZ protein